jgi:tetratricopeptide (TPR) repeat protein
MGGGQSHIYELPLEKDQYVHIVVQQQKIDVVLTVFGPDNLPRAEVDRPNGSIGPEAISVIADVKGTYRLKIRSLESKVSAGQYEVLCSEPRLTEPRDKKFIAAEAAVTEAERLRSSSTATSLATSIKKFDEAFNLWRELDEPYEEAIALYGRGWSNNLLCEYDEAITHFGEALLIMQTLHDDYGQAIALTGIAYCYMYLGEHKKALENFQSALELHQKLNNLRGKAATISGIAAIQTLVGREQEALVNYSESLQLRKQTGDRWNVALNLLGIGKTYSRMGKYDEALSYLNEALDSLRSLPSRAGEADTLKYIGWAYYEKKHDEEALSYFREAYSISQLVGDQKAEASTLYGMARVEYRQDNLFLAREHMDNALNIIETLRMKITSEQFRASFFATVQQYYDFYIDILMRLQQLHPTGSYAAEALQVSERGRARLLLDILAEARTDLRSGVDPALIINERAIQKQFNAKMDYHLRLQSKNTPPDQLAASRLDIEEAQKRYDEIEKQIRRQSPGYAALKNPVPLSLTEIQRQIIDPDTVLLEYELGDERCYLWAVTTDSVHSFTLPQGSPQIKEAARKMIEMLTDAGGTIRSFELAANNLTKMLLPEAAASKVRQKGRVLIVANGILQYLPFNALSLANPANRYTPLVAEHEVISLPSVSTLGVLRAQFGARKPAPKSVLVLADPVFTNQDQRIRNSWTTADAIMPASVNVAQAMNETAAQSDTELTQLFSLEDARIRAGVELLRLPGTRSEARAIQQLAPNATLALDFSASLATVTRPSVADYRIIHFATHGIALDSHPELSGIVLSLFDKQGQPQEGYLGLPTVYNMHIPAELIVLSACETGLGEEVRGEGLIGLTRGFMYAGTPRVVASLWKVRESATEELMKRFYTAIFRKGMRPSAALNYAEASMWKEQKWTPSDWAGFIFFGEWRLNRPL